MALRTVLFLAWPQFDAVEVQFWRRLRDALREQGLRLVLASDAIPPVDLGIPHLRAPRRVDAIWPVAEAPIGLPGTALGLDLGALLDRESNWGEPGIVAAVDRLRREGIDHVASYWASVLATLRPVVTVIWNGQHVPELILDALCRRGGCPVVVAERAPVPRALFIDDRGTSAASGVAQRAVWESTDAPRWRAVADRVTTRMAAGGMTWWEQPALGDDRDLRRTLGVRPDQRVVMFAGQVDEDTQQFMFSPHFASNLLAFRWLLDRVRERRDVFVLGKHHPKSGIPIEAYRNELAASGVPGVWRDDIAIDDALAASDRVAAVNSTVLYEALSRGISCLAMGQWLIGGRGAAMELDDLRNGPALIERWLSDAEPDSAARMDRWRGALAVLLESSIYAYESAVTTGGMNGADELARRLGARAEGISGWEAPEALVDAMLTTVGGRAVPWWVPWDQAWLDDLLRRVIAESTDWQRWHGMRETLKRGREAARAGRRVIVWGTGAAGTRVATMLAGLSVEPSAFCRSAARAGETFRGRPVVTPDALEQSPRAYVLVASSAHLEIVTQLEMLGLCRSRDFGVVDIESLAELMRTEESGALAMS